MRLFALTLLAASAWLGGCGGNLLQSDEPVPATYRLTTPSPAVANTTAAAGTLGITVARPRAAASLDTDRIAVVEPGRRFDYYAGVRWSEPAPQMLQQALVAALFGSGRFDGVFAAPTRVPAELLLDVELRRFEADTSAAGAPVVHVQVQASLIDGRRAGRVTSFLSDASVSASANRRADIIDAFDKANAQVVADVVARVGAATATLPAVTP
jgi:cholesterol transport system auxiliary component